MWPRYRRRSHGGGVSGGAGGGAPSSAETWDPANKGTSTTLSNGNLTANIAGAYDWALSTPSKATGAASTKRYFEVLIGTQTNASWRVFATLATQDPTVANPAGQAAGIGGDSTIVGSGSIGAGYAAGDVLGAAVDATGVKIVVAFYKNGSLNTTVTATSNHANAAMVIGADQISAGGQTHQFTIRTASPDFSYAPPSGYSAWGVT